MNYTKTKLTNRLQLVYDMVPKVESIADIGTDHGYLPVALVLGEKVNKAIAGDVNEGPLNAARKYIKSMSLDEKIDCRLGNGLQVLKKNEVNAVTICGMGGFLMADLLKMAPYKPQILILQPQNGRRKLRKELLKLGYTMKQEALVEDMGHIYDVWVWHLEEKEELNCIYKSLPEEDIRWDIGAYICDNEDLLLEKLLKRLIKVENNILKAMVKSSKENPKQIEHKIRLEKLEECYAKYC